MDKPTRVDPFPTGRWENFTKRITKASREFTKRWKQDHSGYRVDGKAILVVNVQVFMRGNGELIGWLNPHIRGLEPRSHDWFKEFKLGETNSGNELFQEID